MKKNALTKKHYLLAIIKSDDKEALAFLFEQLRSQGLPYLGESGGGYLEYCAPEEKVAIYQKILDQAAERGYWMERYNPPLLIQNWN